MQDWSRLAGRIASRRINRGYTSRAALAAVAHVAVRTVDSLERGDREYMQPKTAAKLEAALEWPPGAFARILAGSEPTDASQPVEGADVTPERAVSTLLEQIVKVRRHFGDAAARAFVDGAFARPVESSGHPGDGEQPAVSDQGAR